MPRRRRRRRRPDIIRQVGWLPVLSISFYLFVSADLAQQKLPVSKEGSPVVLDHSETAPVGAYWTPVSVRHLCNGRRGARRTRDLDLLLLLRRGGALEAVVSGELNILREERGGGSVEGTQIDHRRTRRPARRARRGRSGQVRSFAWGDRVPRPRFTLRARLDLSPGRQPYLGLVCTVCTLVGW